eukprot:7393_1
MSLKYSNNEDDMNEMSISDLQNCIANNKLTSYVITKHFLDRIKHLNPLLNAVIEVNPNALKTAQILDNERYNKGTTRGPLHGIPVLIKDNIDTDKNDSMNTTAGSLALKNINKPSRDAYIIQQMKTAGCIILGKTNLSEWANIRGKNSIDGWSARGGLCKNPHNLNKTALGSSSGSAAAIAARLAPLAVGTETNGSISCPSMVCGIVGLKPTVGYTSRRGIIPISYSCDSAGPMGKTVQDVMHLYNAMIGLDIEYDIEAMAWMNKNKKPQKINFPLSSNILSGKRIGVLRGNLYEFDNVIQKSFDVVLNVLRNAGCIIVDNIQLLQSTIDVLTGISHDGKISNILKLYLYELKYGMKKYLKTRKNSKIKTLKDIVEFNKKHKNEELKYFGQEHFEESVNCLDIPNMYHARLRRQLREATRENGIDYLLQKYNLDCLIAPSGIDAFDIPILEKRVNVKNNINIKEEESKTVNDLPKMINRFSTSTLTAMAGYPLLVVPMINHSISKMPLGVSFMGTGGSDHLLLQIGYGYEQEILKYLKRSRIVPFRNSKL